ncbi:MAG TPA: hypothetical protein VFM75_02035 [Modicisalibacter sp.]|nr:hypothetical protein [Modicisalibacter sp.]
MRNADNPAMPGSLDPQSAGFMDEFSGGVYVKDLARWNSGLSKREHIAAMALQGLLSHGGPNGEAAGWEAEHAVSYADALLAELERTGGGS